MLGLDTIGLVQNLSPPVFASCFNRQHSQTTRWEGQVVVIRGDREQVIGRFAAFYPRLKIKVGIFDQAFLAKDLTSV